MATIRHLGLDWGNFTPPTESNWWSLSLCQFGYDLWSVQYLVYLAGKCLFTHKNWGFVAIRPLNGLQYQRKPIKAHPCMSRRHMSHQAWTSGEWSDLQVSSLKRYKWKNGRISPICPVTPHRRISTKFCIAVEVIDVITCDNFSGDRLKDVDSVGGEVEIGGFPLTKPLAVNTPLTQLRREWCVADRGYFVLAGADFSRRVASTVPPDIRYHSGGRRLWWILPTRRLRSLRAMLAFSITVVVVVAVVLSNQVLLWERYCQTR